LKVQSKTAFPVPIADHGNRIGMLYFVNFSPERAAEERPDSQNPEVVAAHHGDVGVLRLTGPSTLDGDVGSPHITVDGEHA